MTPTEKDIREHLARVLAWEEAHATFDAAVGDLPEPLRGRTPDGLPYSPWQLVEHLRITQHDLLDFCRNPEYEELAWPDEYWPKSPVAAFPDGVGREPPSLPRRPRGTRAAGARSGGGSDGAHPARHGTDLPPRDPARRGSRRLPHRRADRGAPPARCLEEGLTAVAGARSAPTDAAPAQPLLVFAA